MNVRIELGVDLIVEVEDGAQFHYELPRDAGIIEIEEDGDDFRVTVDGESLECDSFRA